VPDLANSAGFSRFHLGRLFHQTTEETLEQFLRRIRLERAAYMLLNSGQSVLEISIDIGYQSPEAFSRAFRQAHGCLPTAFRKKGGDWKLHSPTDLHWNADWVVEGQGASPWKESVVSMPTRYACVWRAIRNYSRLEESWQKFEEAFAGQIPPKATFITVYRDNMWTHPVSNTMRADIGWLCPVTYMPPRGMRRIVIPGGCYAMSRFVARHERNDAWSYFGGHYSLTKSLESPTLSYDEYATWPLPFAQVQTRIMAGVDPR
jgi:AraC family transcriptional regulator